MLMWECGACKFVILLGLQMPNNHSAPSDAHTLRPLTTELSNLGQHSDHALPYRRYTVSPPSHNAACYNNSWSHPPSISQRCQPDSLDAHFSQTRFRCKQPCRLSAQSAPRPMHTTSAANLSLHCGLTHETSTSKKNADQWSHDTHFHSRWGHRLVYFGGFP